MANTLDHEGNKSLKHTETDRERAETLGIEQNSVSTEHSESLRIREEFQGIQEQAAKLQEGLKETGATSIGQLTKLVNDIVEVDADYDGEK